MSPQMRARATIAAAMTIAGLMTGARGQLVDDEEVGGDAGIAMITEMAMIVDTIMDMRRARERRQEGGQGVRMHTRRCRRSRRGASRRDRHCWDKRVTNHEVSKVVVLM